MARLFTSGFEENNLLETMWLDFNPTQHSISTVQKHSGTYALRANPTSNNTGVFKRLSPNKNSGTVWTRVYYRVASFPVGGDATLHTIESSSFERSVEAWLIDVGGNKRIRLVNVITGTNQDSSFNLSADTWYRIEVRLLISDTVGEAELRHYTGDSTTPDFTLSITGEDTLPTNIEAFAFGSYTNNQTSDIFLDDIAINDDAGAAPFNTWTGPGKIFLIEPASDVSVAWTKSGSVPAATNWEGVDDLPGTPNDATDYNSDSGTTNVDRLGLTNLGAEVGSGDDIILLDAYARVQGGAASQTAILRIWDEGGTPSDGPSIALPNGSWGILSTAEHQVFEAGTRTKANIDSFDAGYKGASGASAKDITALWLNVEWIEAVAGGLGIPIAMYHYMHNIGTHA